MSEYPEIPSIPAELPPTRPRTSPPPSGTRPPSGSRAATSRGGPGRSTPPASTARTGTASDARSPGPTTASASRPRGQGLRIFNCDCGKHLGQVAIIPTTAKPLGLEAGIGGLLLLQQADRELSHQRQVLATVTRMVPALVLAEHHIEHPVQ